LNDEKEITVKVIAKDDDTPPKKVTLKEKDDIEVKL